MKYLIDIYSLYYQEIVIFTIIIFLSIPVTLFIKKILISTINNYLVKYYQNYEKILRKNSVYHNLFHGLLSLYFLVCDNLFHSNPHLIIHVFVKIKNAAIIGYSTVAITLLLLSLVDASSEIYQKSSKEKKILAHVSLYLQIFKIIIFAIALIITLSKLLNISVGAFFTSLGAAAAILTFVFKDSVLGLMSSLQLIEQDIIRIGDKVTINSFKIEGTVEKITITIVKIRNFDQTISTIPTYSLLTTHILNWRGITEAGAKQIKKQIPINIGTINFTNDETINMLKSSHYTCKTSLSKIFFADEIGQNTTNLKLYISYLEYYLKNNNFLHQEHFPISIKLGEATIAGVLIEISAFTKHVDTDSYNMIQNDIFDHILSVLPEFKLQAHQS